MECETIILTTALSDQSPISSWGTAAKLSLSIREFTHCCGETRPFGECGDTRITKMEKTLALVSIFATFSALKNSGKRLFEKDVDSPRRRTNL